jgi:hypothetical protein
MPFTSPFEDTLHVGGSAYRHASLALLADRHPPLRRLPKVLKILAEITLRRAPAELPAYLDWVAPWRFVPAGSPVLAGTGAHPRLHLRAGLCRLRRPA